MKPIDLANYDGIRGIFLFAGIFLFVYGIPLLWKYIYLRVNGMRTTGTVVGFQAEKRTGPPSSFRYYIPLVQFKGSKVHNIKIPAKELRFGISLFAQPPNAGYEVELFYDPKKNTTALVVSDVSLYVKLFASVVIAPFLLYSAFFPLPIIALYAQILQFIEEFLPPMDENTLEFMERIQTPTP